MVEKVTKEFIKDLADYMDGLYPDRIENTLMLPYGSVIPDEIKEYAKNLRITIVIDPIKPKHFNMEMGFNVNWLKK